MGTMKGEARWSGLGSVAATALARSSLTQRWYQLNLAPAPERPRATASPTLEIPEGNLLELIQS